MYIWALALTLFGFSSCLKDHSTDAVNAISRIEVVKPLEAQYTAQRWSTITIEAPQLKQSNVAKEISYEWQINYKTVGQGATLTYLCEHYGVFPGRLKITNGDEIKYIDFSLEVPLPYGKGLYALAEKGGRVILSYEPVDAEGKSFVLDALASNNKQVDFSGSASAITYSAVPSRTSVPSMFIGLSNPDRMYTLHADSMLVTKKTELPGPVQSLLQRTKLTNIITQGGIVTLDFDEFILNNASWRGYNATLGGVELANDMVGWRKTHPTLLHGLALWDNKVGRLIAINADESVNVALQPLPQNPFAGYKLLRMVQADDRRKLGLFLYKETENTIMHALVHPGLYRYSSTEVNAQVEHQGVVAASANLDRNSAITSAPARDIAYYSHGASVYGYSLKSAGNFTGTPLFTLSDASATIADMLVSPDERYLYIAANNTSGDLVGSLYCYDLVNNSMLWERKNVTGQVKKLSYRAE